MNEENSDPNWISRGKTISELIEELRSLEDQGREVFISINDGKDVFPISLVYKKGMTACVLAYCGDFES